VTTASSNSSNSDNRIRFNDDDDDDDDDENSAFYLGILTDIPVDSRRRAVVLFLLEARCVKDLQQKHFV